MQSVILAGGYGKRLSELTKNTPKPLIQIGNYPILTHIMKIYSYWKLNDFIICLGYKGDHIKKYFDKSTNNIKNEFIFNNDFLRDVNISLLDTGLDTMTGGRILRCKKSINSTFSVTYGDSLLDININELIKFHKSHKKLATITAIKKRSRFHLMDIYDSSVKEIYTEGDKNPSWTNGGFFILEPEVFDYIEDDDTVWEEGPLKRLTQDSQLMAFKHEGFWHPMDTLNDKDNLEKMWGTDNAPWKLWGN